jgi:protein TonB
MSGVYRSVFEQSLLLTQGAKRPWNFLASLSAELLIIILALLIPLLYRDHLPVVHWKDITVGPAPSPPPPLQPARTNHSGDASSVVARPVFHLGTGTNAHPSQSPTEIAVDAPPTLGSGMGVGGSTNTLGTFIPNYVVAPPPPKPSAVAPKPPTAPITVGGDVQMAKLVRKVIPEYPSLARSARISGVVRLIGTIGKDGAIRNLELVSGHPLLAHAALAAVQQWVYKPTLLNGNPVEVIAPIEVRFTLGP